MPNDERTAGGVCPDWILAAHTAEAERDALEAELAATRALVALADRFVVAFETDDDPAGACAELAEALLRHDERRLAEPAPMRFDGPPLCVSCERPMQKVAHAVYA